MPAHWSFATRPQHPAPVARMSPASCCCSYLPVNKEPSREIFYSFVESEGNPEQDPLLVWLQG